jgi:aspartate dehydrogenase
VLLFPQNVNVAAAIALAGVGLEKTTVRIVADPAAARNVHEIFVRGAFGEAAIRLANLPNPANPRSSYLAGLSVIATLRELVGTLRIGT